MLRFSTLTGSHTLTGLKKNFFLPLNFQYFFIFVYNLSPPQI